MRRLTFQLSFDITPEVKYHAIGTTMVEEVGPILGVKEHFDTLISCIKRTGMTYKVELIRSELLEDSSQHVMIVPKSQPPKSVA